MAFTTNFQCNTSSQHFEAIGKKLLERRQNGDKRNCDVCLKLRNNEEEMVDSSVISGHSPTLAEVLKNCRRPPQRQHIFETTSIDLTSLDEVAVRHVVNWMYSGIIDLSKADVEGVLIVAAQLKVSALRRDLENYLRAQALQNGFIFAINTATAESFIVTEETITHLTLVLSRKLDVIFDTDIVSLSLNSIVAIMSTLLPAEKKVPLVNMAIKWLKFQNTDSAVKEVVVKSIAMSDMNGDSLFEVQNGLLAHLKRRNFDIRLVNTIDGHVAIQDRNLRYNQGTPQPSTRTNSDYSTFSSSSSSSAQRVYPTQSQIADLRSIPDVFERSPYQRQLENPVEQSQSLRDQRAAVPDPFSSRTTSSTSGYSRVERSNSLERGRPSSRFSVATSGFDKPGSRGGFGKQRSSRRTLPPVPPMPPAFANVKSIALSGGMDDPLRSPDVSQPSTSRNVQESSEESNTETQPRSQYLYPK